MADLANIADVEIRYRRLRDQEVTNASSWITDASEILRDEITDLDARATASASFERRVRATVAGAVIRMLRGQDPRDPADYSSIFYTKYELASLTSLGGAGRVSSLVLTTTSTDEAE